MEELWRREEEELWRREEEEQSPRSASYDLVTNVLQSHVEYLPQRKLHLLRLLLEALMSCKSSS